MNGSKVDYYTKLRMMTRFEKYAYASVGVFVLFMVYVNTVHGDRYFLPQNLRKHLINDVWPGVRLILFYVCMAALTARMIATRRNRWALLVYFSGWVVGFTLGVKNAVVLFNFAFFDLVAIQLVWLVIFTKSTHVCSIEWYSSGQTGLCDGGACCRITWAFAGLMIGLLVLTAVYPIKFPYLIEGEVPPNFYVMRYCHQIGSSQLIRFGEVITDSDHCLFINERQQVRQNVSFDEAITTESCEDLLHVRGDGWPNRIKCNVKSIGATSARQYFVISIEESHEFWAWSKDVYHYEASPHSIHPIIQFHYENDEYSIIFGIILISITFLYGLSLVLCLIFWYWKYRRSHKHVLINVKQSLIFGILGAILVLHGLGEGKWWLLVVWLGADFLAMALAYATGWHAIFGKDHAGIIPLGKRLFLAPYLIFTSLTWHLYRLLDRETATNVISDQLVIGRRLLPEEVPGEFDNYIDLTAEFEDPPAIRRHPSYVVFPVLDASAPTVERLAEAIKGMRPGRTYIHCAQGHGRTGLFAIALLLASGDVAEVSDGLEKLRKIRPGVSLSRIQIQCLEDFRTILRESATTPT